MANIVPKDRHIGQNKCQNAIHSMYAQHHGQWVPWSRYLAIVKRCDQYEQLCRVQFDQLAIVSAQLERKEQMLDKEYRNRVMREIKRYYEGKIKGPAFKCKTCGFVDLEDNDTCQACSHGELPDDPVGPARWEPIK